VRSCHTLPVRQAAHRRPGYPARFHSPDLLEPVRPDHSRRAAILEPSLQAASCSQKRNLRVGDSWVYALPSQETKTISWEPWFVGAWGKICARQTCRYEGQTAAHGQITERKHSVTHFRFSFPSRNLPGLGCSFRLAKNPIGTLDFASPKVDWIFPDLPSSWRINQRHGLSQRSRSQVEC
jgi:hypothetical protein